MSVNSYTRGCHLLNHDDVIGTRRVSYILYMPLPNYQLWQKDWGGALELYPVQLNKDGQFEPEAVPSKSIPPSWNQFIFFEVQPGKSFHSVEEVVVGGEGEDGRTRLSISGWFHAAQEGEEGYVPEPPTESKSSREQLVRTLSSDPFSGSNIRLGIHIHRLPRLHGRTRHYRGRRARSCRYRFSLRVSQPRLPEKTDYAGSRRAFRQGIIP